MLAAILLGPLALIWYLICPKDEDAIERNMLKSEEAKKFMRWVT